jgi:hypothetical protein
MYTSPFINSQDFLVAFVEIDMRILIFLALSMTGAVEVFQLAIANLTVTYQCSTPAA